MASTDTTLEKATADILKKLQELPTKVTKNPMELTITLGPVELSRISDAMGGKILKTPEDIVRIIENSLRLTVDGSAVALDIEDAQALKDYFPSSGMSDYKAYIEASVKEALCSYLWGSTRGILSR